MKTLTIILNSLLLTFSVLTLQACQSTQIPSITPIAAEYAIYEGDDFVEDVLRPRAEEYAQSVDLLSWASDAQITDASTLFAMALYRDIEGLQRYEFADLNLIVAKLISTGFFR